MSTKLNTGTSGFSFKQWRGPFYPEGCKAADYLSHYSSQLSSVEINASFYRIPNVDTLRSWAEQVPPSFRFAFKASRRITHFMRLRDCDELLEVMLTRMMELGERLGALLFQLPPDFPADLPLLKAFVRNLPRTTRYAMEFRHPSWFTAEVMEILDRSGLALCAADQQARDLLSVSTAEWGYLRIRDDHIPDEAELRELATWITSRKWQEAFAYFKHEDGAVGPALCRNLARHFAAIQ